MNWTIDALQPGGHFSVKVEGPFSLDDLDAMNREIIGHPLWQPGRDLLFDDTELETENIKAPDIESIADVIASHADHFGHSRMAIVVSTDVQYGLARQLQGITEGRANTRIGVFRKKSAAENWLEE